MEDHPIHILRDGLTGSASLDTAVSRAILRRVSDGELPETLQVGRPHRVVAFGKHDTLTPGFDRAVSIASDHGFDPTIRIAGGRAVVFHPETVRFTWTVPLVDPIAEMQDRFQTIAKRVVSTLTSFDIPSSIGQLSGEYCPGRYSVHVDGTGKVMGSGQRLSLRAAQIAGMIVVRDKTMVNEILVPVYAALGLDMDPSRTGAVADHTDVATAAVMDRFIEQFTVGRMASEGTLDDITIDLATASQPDHDPRILA